MEKQDTSALMETLKGAIDMEIKGQAFYNETAAATDNELTRHIFNSLAADEVLHQEAIKKYYDKLAAEEKLPDIKDILAGGPERDRSVFDKPFDELAQDISRQSSAIEAYKAAMELEVAGYDYYDKLLHTTEVPEMLELLKFIMKEENQHYSILQRTYEYLTRPQDAYDDEQPNTFEG